MFSSFHSHQLLTAAHSGTEQPDFQAFIYTLDVLLPIITLHQRDAWVAHAAAQGWVVAFTLAGWLLATAVVASLSGILRKD